MCGTWGSGYRWLVDAWMEVIGSIADVSGVVIGGVLCGLRHSYAQRSHTSRLNERLL